MRYEVIDKDLKLYSCGIGDLTYQQVRNFLKAWGEESTISELTVFYDQVEGVIVINRDNEEYELCKELVISYMKSSPDKKETFRKKFCEVEFATEIMKVIDNALLEIEGNRILFWLQNQNGKDEEYEPDFLELLAVFKKIQQQYHFSHVHFWMYKAFQYGMMIGKRIERVRCK